MGKEYTSLGFGVISWTCQIKSRGTFFSNVSELFRKLFDCPRSLWDITNNFTGLGCEYIEAIPCLFGFYLFVWSVGCFYDLGCHFCSSEFAGMASAYVVSIFKISCSLGSVILRR